VAHHRLKCDIGGEGYGGGNDVFRVYIDGISPSLRPCGGGCEGRNACNASDTAINKTVDETGEFFACTTARWGSTSQKGDISCARRLAEPISPFRFHTRTARALCRMRRALENAVRRIIHSQTPAHLRPHRSPLVYLAPLPLPALSIHSRHLSPVLQSRTAPVSVA